MTQKERKDKLIKLADEVIRNSSIYKNEMIESESYNGQIAAFPVTVALSGLKAAMVLYYNVNSKSEINKQNIIELLAEMYNKDEKQNLDKDTFYHLIIKANDSEIAKYRRLIVEYAIALKLTIRTFKFK